MQKNLPLKITAILASPLCGEPPLLDALLERQAALHAREIERTDRAGRHRNCAWEAHRGAEPPPPGRLPIPIERADCAGWPVAKCSAPIWSGAAGFERMQKSIRTAEIADYLGGARMSIHHGSGATKDYFLPRRVTAVERVIWFCVGYGFAKGNGQRRNPEAQLRQCLRRIRAIGQDTTTGYGRVTEWRVEPAPADYSWYAPAGDRGRVLMRPLPLAGVPADAVGWRPGWAAVCGPYWHAQRQIAAALPC